MFSSSSSDTSSKQPGGSKDQYTGEDKTEGGREGNTERRKLLSMEQWRKTTGQSWKMKTATKTMG
jgi:hypothetical protein